LKVIRVTLGNIKVPIHAGTPRIWWLL